MQTADYVTVKEKLSNAKFKIHGNKPRNKQNGLFDMILIYNFYSRVVPFN